MNSKLASAAAKAACEQSHERLRLVPRRNNGVAGAGAHPPPPRPGMYLGITVRTANWLAAPC